MKFVTWWVEVVVDAVEDLAMSRERRQAGHERSIAVERERLIREIEVSEGHRSSVWGSQR